MATYFGNILNSNNGRIPESYFANVTGVMRSTLNSQIKKLNYAIDACQNKGSLSRCAEIFRETANVPSVEKLVERLNTPVLAGSMPLHRLPNVNGKTLNGPHLLPFLTDRFWLEWMQPVAAGQIKGYMQMVDPEQDGGDSGQMLSSGKLGFKTLGICFRGDTRGYEEFDTGGFTARYSLPPGHPFHIEEAYGTIATSGMFLDKVARDFVNQTGVCVARNLLGSMKFIGSCSPDGKTVYNRKGHLFALKFDQGLDTEDMQLAKVSSTGSKSVLWRAGEKAAHSIPKTQFLASCEFEVDNPYHTNENPVFRFRRNSDWAWHNATEAHKDYLRAATANINTGEWYDFTRRHDWAANP